MTNELLMKVETLEADIWALSKIIETLEEYNTEVTSQNKRMREALIKIHNLARNADEYRAVSEIDDICESLKEVGDDSTT